jgi:acyl-CoA dehydrogenase
VNFELDDAQQAMADLAGTVLADHGGAERARAVEQAGGFDRGAWDALGSTGLLAAVAAGDGGVVGAAQLALAVGRHAVSLPAHAVLTPLVLLGESRPGLVDAAGLVTTALHEVGAPDAAAVATRAHRGALTGEKPAVAALREAAAVLVSAEGGEGPGLHLLEVGAPGVGVVDVRTTDRLAAAHLVLDEAPATAVGGRDAVVRAEQVAAVLACATLVGLGRAAAEGAAAYVRERHQFGRPIASFQGPVLRLADAHIDLEAMHVTMLQAAWQLDQGEDAGMAVSVARWWSAEGAHRTLHTAQHLHGGIGADVDYPAHRYFLRGKQLIDTLGGGPVHAQRLGAAIAAAQDVR